MLNQPATYPHPGSTAYLRGTAGECRIIQHTQGESALVAIVPTRFDRIHGGASGNRTVPLADLYPSAIEAQFCGRVPARLRHMIPVAA